MKNQKQNESRQFKLDVAGIIANGGATLDRNGASVNFKNGYQVSKKDCYTLNAEKLNDVKKAVEKVLNRINHESGLFCGIWVDSGLVYIDISERIKNERKALAIGKARKQISIFNWADSSCVYC